MDHTSVRCRRFLSEKVGNGSADASENVLIDREPGRILKMLSRVPSEGSQKLHRNGFFRVGRYRIRLSGFLGCALSVGVPWGVSGSGRLPLVASAVRRGLGGAAHARWGEVSGLVGVGDGEAAGRRVGSGCFGFLGLLNRMLCVRGARGTHDSTGLPVESFPYAWGGPIRPLGFFCF